MSENISRQAKHQREQKKAGAKTISVMLQKDDVDKLQRIKEHYRRSVTQILKDLINDEYAVIERRSR